MAVGTALLILLWAVLAAAVREPMLVPSISQTCARLGAIVREESFFRILGTTLARTAGGYALSLATAAFFGIPALLSASVRSALEPAMRLMRSIPTIAMIVLALIWLRADSVPIFTCFVAITPALYDAISGAASEEDLPLMEMARAYGVSRGRVFRVIELHRIRQAIGRLLPFTLGLALKMTVAGEVLAQPAHSIGEQLSLRKIQLDTAGVFAWILIILAAGECLRALAFGCASVLGSRQRRFSR